MEKSELETRLAHNEQDVASCSSAVLEKILGEKSRGREARGTRVETLDQYLGVH